MFDLFAGFFVAAIAAGVVLLALHEARLYQRARRRSVSDDLVAHDPDDWFADHSGSAAYPQRGDAE